jgi:hypothetical protein
MKRMADWLTASRAVIAVAIASLGFWGREALWVVVLLFIAGWTTDVLDGRLARQARRLSLVSARPRDRLAKLNSWLGEHEFGFDMLMVFSGLVYMAKVGYVSPELAVVYTGIAGVVIALLRSKSVTELFAFPLTALPLVIAYEYEPWVAYLYLAWIALALLFDWGRFVGVVREFLQGMKRLRNL